ncbi:MAG TPA: ABC transporter ATP-binding protein [Ornithinibacter sp.]|nr:ABC transporter ATP-binding protein [Ornithinibacter sp.]
MAGSPSCSRWPPFKRPTNTVFQSYALFPHLSVEDNVAFGLRRKGVGKGEVRRRVGEELERVGLAMEAKRKPRQLSGGQQQRVALARALINRPAVLLLDEPLGALDLKLRRQMQIELKRIQHDVGLTFIHVTHDQEEAMTMADTIAVMNAGHLEQLGDPATLYEHPASTFVANFLGQSNLLRARVTGPGEGGLMQAEVHGHEILLEADRVPAGLTDVWVGVRPEKLALGEDGGRNHLQGTVTDVSFTGVATQYLVRMPWDMDVVVVQQNDGSARARFGEAVTLSWDPGREFVLDAAQDDHAGMDQVLVDG